LARDPPPSPHPAAAGSAIDAFAPTGNRRARARSLAKPRAAVERNLRCPHSGPRRAVAG